MAVAVKNTPEVSSASRFDRLTVASLLGVVYAIGCVGIVFGLIPYWWPVLTASAGMGGFLSGCLETLVVVAALVFLVWLGGQVLGTRTVPGVRAGVFVGLVGFLLILLLTRWASLWLEYATYDRHLFSPSAGMVMTAVVGVVLLLLGIRLFLRTRTEQVLLRFESQGWFTAKTYKPQQGLRVRRGTVLGLLLIAGAGVYTLGSRGTLTKGPRDWYLNVPFTGQVTIENLGDVREPGVEVGSVVNRYTFQSINQNVDPATHVKIFLPQDAVNYKVDEIVKRDEFDAKVRELKKKGEMPPIGVDPVPASGPLQYYTLTLLPSVQYTVPLLLILATLWLSWRIVSMPAFADFLIATEAELNKVSWATQRRLVQDTIVVLATVILLSGYLFAMDQLWRFVLSSKPIGVLVLPENTEEKNAGEEEKPY